jgi:hypothetical protein
VLRALLPLPTDLPHPTSSFCCQTLPSCAGTTPSLCQPSNHTLPHTDMRCHPDMRPGPLPSSPSCCPAAAAAAAAAPAAASASASAAAAAAAPAAPAAAPLLLPLLLPVPPHTHSPPLPPHPFTHLAHVAADFSEADHVPRGAIQQHLTRHGATRQRGGITWGEEADRGGEKRGGRCEGQPNRVRVGECRGVCNT